MNLDEREDNFSYNYKIMHDEIIKLKQEKIMFDNSIELIKNYLIILQKFLNF